jgi:hypothetical protein
MRRAVVGAVIAAALLAGASAGADDTVKIGVGTCKSASIFCIS